MNTRRPPLAPANELLTTATQRCAGEAEAPQFWNLVAGKILARVSDIGRFRSAAAFASYTGTAPIEVSSGDVVRHRLSRAGDRQLNSCLHNIAITQIRHETLRTRLPPGGY